MPRCFSANALVAPFVVAVVSFVAGCANESQTGSTSDEPNGEQSAESTAAATGDSAMTLADFSIFPEDDDSWADGHTITCAGKTKGYIYTNQSYGAGTLNFEYRYPADLAEDVIPNTGVLLLIEPPHKKWPRCIEAQGKQSEAGQLKGNGGVTDLAPEFNDEALANAINAPGEWNAVEVVISDDKIVATWNGQQTATCGLGGLSSGPIGFQSEGNPVEFRNIRFVPSGTEN